MYNSLKYTKTLEATGFTREQAEATINLVIETMDYHFATKTDLQGMETSIRSDIKDIRTEMKEIEKSIRSDMKDMETSIRSDMKEMETSIRSDMKDIRTEMKEMEARLTLKLGGMMLGGIALLEFLR